MKTKEESREYYKNYRKEHPEKTQQYFINSYIRKLQQLGYIVIDPKQCNSTSNSGK